MNWFDRDWNRDYTNGDILLKKLEALTEVLHEIKELMEEQK